LFISQINLIIKAMSEDNMTSDQHHSNPKKTRQTDDGVASIAAAIESDQQRTDHELAAMHDLPFGTIHTILADDLVLVKNSDCWDPKSTAQKQERVECSCGFLNLVQRLTPLSA
jgi:hypothetical protein